jgi:hypothetical protein
VHSPPGPGRYTHVHSQLLLAIVGGACGQLYIKAQLAVKRHMSVAHAPVLGHFGAAITGMGESCLVGADAAGLR